MSRTIPALTPDGHLPVRRLKGRGRAEIFARVRGYFWLPCVTCGQLSGGHEWVKPFDGALPHCPPLFPELSPHTSRGLCPACLEAGVHTLWKLVAPPAWGTVSFDLDELDGPFGHLVHAKLGIGVQP